MSAMPPPTPKSENPGWGTAVGCYSQEVTLFRGPREIEMVKATLGAGSHQGASNPTHSSHFTQERMAAQRCQVTQMESHSPWLAEPGRVIGSWSGVSKPAQDVCQKHLQGIFKSTGAQARTQEVRIPQSEVGIGNPGV